MHAVVTFVQRNLFIFTVPNVFFTLQCQTRAVVTNNVYEQAIKPINRVTHASDNETKMH